MVYFLGTAGPPPLVAWSPETPAFHIGELSASESSIISHFETASVVRYLGSHHHCGCGFRCDTLDVEADEAVGKQDSHDRLADYLVALPKDVHPVQIYGCWSGEEAEPTEHLRRVSVDRLREADFEFRERELLTISFRGPATSRR